MMDALRLIPIALVVITIYFAAVLSHRVVSHRDRLVVFGMLMLLIVSVSAWLIKIAYIEEVLQPESQLGFGKRPLAKIHIMVETTKTLREHISPASNVGLTMWKVQKVATKGTRMGSFHEQRIVDISGYSEKLEKDLEVETSGNPMWFPFDSYNTTLLFTIEPPKALTDRAIALREAIAQELPEGWIEDKLIGHSIGGENDVAAAGSGDNGYHQLPRSHAPLWHKGRSPQLKRRGAPTRFHVET
jgi:hypothetical protein